MKLKFLFIVGLITALAACSSSNQTMISNPVTESGVVKITWHDPQKYTDIDAAGELQSRFEQKVFATLTADLNKQASKVLKANEKLVLMVTNVDLAGDVRPTFGEVSNDIRVVKDIYPPRIAFSYKVIKDNRVVLSGDEKLQDMFFMSGIQPLAQRPYMYEASLLTHWFNKKISPRFEGSHQSSY